MTARETETKRLLLQSTRESNGSGQPDRDKILIRDYEEKDWKDIEIIHDGARKTELRLARLEDAFVPLAQAAEKEGLFE